MKKASHILILSILLISFIYIYGHNTYRNIDEKALAFYINNESSNSMPGKNDGYDFDHADCTNGASIIWDDNDWGVKVSNLSQSRTKCTLYFVTHRDPNERTLNYLATLNSSYVESNSNKCLTTNASGMITNYSTTLTDSDTPIICEMEDDYGSSYYLRGNHTYNNVVFAGSCWKILRITGTGGIKMMYNGEVDGNGKCVSPTINMSSTTYNGQLGQNNSVKSPAYAGYMYNAVYQVLSPGSGSASYYGSSFTYNSASSRPYTLTNTIQQQNLVSSADSNHHYTCFYGTNNTCDRLYAIVYVRNGSLYYIELQGNETLSGAVNKMVGNNVNNTTNSVVKTAVDTWYESKIKNTPNASKLEDTVFCNERKPDNLAGWSETGTLSYSTYLKFNAINNKYYLKCQQQSDAFTVSDTTHGNGALTYPVGLLSATDMILIGNNTARKYGTNDYWISSPSIYDDTEGIIIFFTNSSGAISSDYGFAYVSRKIRPAVSLKSDTIFVSGGDGSASNPFVVQ